MPNFANMMMPMRNWWDGATPPTRAAAVGLCLLVVIGLIIAAGMAASPDYVPIYHGVSGKDASAIDATLREHSIVMQFDDKDGTISVPSKDESNATMYVEAAGILSKDADIAGIETIDKGGFGQSTEVEQQKILYANEGELARKLMKLDPVSTAAVTISPGNNSSLFGDPTDASASVILTLKSGETLDPEQVKGIVNLIAHSVTGLKTQNVTLTDQTGTPLWKDNGAGGNLIGDGQPMDESAKFAEAERLKLQNLLDMTLGARKAIVMVNAELDFDQTQIDVVQHSLPDGQHTPIPISVREKDETYTGGGASPVGGPTGSASNLGGTSSYPSSNSGSGDYKGEDTTTNYADPDTTHKIIQQAPGGIKKLSVSALVDSSVPAAEVASIKSTIETVIGVTPGDLTRMVAVNQIAFDTSAAKAQQTQMQSLASQQMWANVAKIAAVCIVALVLLVMMSRSGGGRRAAAGPQLALAGEGANIGLLEGTSDNELEAILEERPMRIEDVLAEMPDAEPNRPRRRRVHASIEEQQDLKLEAIQDMVSHHPESVALLMKGWMAETS